MIVVVAVVFSLRVGNDLVVVLVCGTRVVVVASADRGPLLLGVPSPRMLLPSSLDVGPALRVGRCSEKSFR
jgi:hypothetical protein